MSNIAIQGAATGTGVFTLASPATNTDRTLTLPDEAGTVLTTASTGGVSQAMLASGVAGTGPALCVQNTATTSISSSTWTKIPFNSVQWDTASLWDSVNYSFTPNVAGYYICTLNAGSTASSSPITITIRKNGTEEWGTHGWGSTNINAQSTSTVVYCNGTTDALTGWVYFGTATTMSGFGWQNTMSITLLRAA